MSLLPHHLHWAIFLLPREGVFGPSGALCEDWMNPFVREGPRAVNLPEMGPGDRSSPDQDMQIPAEEIGPQVATEGEGRARGGIHGLTAPGVVRSPWEGQPWVGDTFELHP
jgi:hypothetical protein